MDMSNEAERAIGPIFCYFPPQVPQVNFGTVQKVVPPTKGLTCIDYPVPQEWRELNEQGLESHLSKNTLLNETKNQLLTPNDISISHYATFFHHVLWMEEFCEELMTSQYNLNKITVTLAENQTYFELKLQKILKENRPSLVWHDIVNIRMHQNNEIVYQGNIIRKFDDSIRIGNVHTDFLHLIKGNSKIELDIAFQPSLIRYIRMHRGLAYIHKNPALLKALHVVPCTTIDGIDRKCEVHLNITSEEDLFNKEIFKNPKQKQAVQNIVNCTSGYNPYILIGPPGTGKTITMVEAILQIKKIFNDSKILVCATTNASCDFLTRKLIPCCTKDELIRVYSFTNPKNNICDNVKPYSNWKDGENPNTSDNKLTHYSILVTTVLSSARYLNVTPYYRPDYVFIDEAALASEPEAVTAIALLSKNFHIVLAGDSQQMGPLVLSKQARKYGLDKSLLETMMTRNLYKDDNPDYVTKLRLNFRSHPYVIQLPNELFYNNQLQTMSEKALHDPIASIYVYFKIYPKKKKIYKKVKDGYAATEFYSLISNDTRDCYSYCNYKEIDLVLETVKALCRLKKEELNPPVTQNDIGIIALYYNQVLRIRESLQKEEFANVEVGSPENFQGREKRIIIISTVRARQKESDVLNDRKDMVGFISNSQKFNVAVTRAMSKLIVIGCPHVLKLDEKHWLQYIYYCVGHNSYFGDGTKCFKNHN